MHPQCVLCVCMRVPATALLGRGTSKQRSLAGSCRDACCATPHVVHWFTTPQVPPRRKRMPLARCKSHQQTETATAGCSPPAARMQQQDHCKQHVAWHVGLCQCKKAGATLAHTMHTRWLICFSLWPQSIQLTAGPGYNICQASVCAATHTGGCVRECSGCSSLQRWPWECKVGGATVRVHLAVAAACVPPQEQPFMHPQLHIGGGPVTKQVRQWIHAQHLMTLSGHPTHVR